MINLKPLVRTVFSLIPSSTIITIAELLAPHPQIAWCPGYRFGNGTRKHSFVRWVRLQVWRLSVLKKRCNVRVRWHEDLVVEVSLGTDFGLCLFVDGMFEPNESMFLYHVLRPGMHFVDVGANIGLYSLFASKQVAKNGRVTAIEPSSREFSALLHHVRLNHLNNVHAYRIALSDHAGDAELLIAEDKHSGHNTLGGFVYSSVRQAHAERVKLQPLDEFVVSECLPKVDVLKVDVEGAEFQVLTGAQRTLRQDRPVVFLELLGPALERQGSTVQAVLELLRSLDYEIYCFDSETGFPVRPRDRVISENAVALPMELSLPSFQAPNMDFRNQGCQC